MADDLEVTKRSEYRDVAREIQEEMDVIKYADDELDYLESRLASFALEQGSAGNRLNQDLLNIIESMMGATDEREVMLLKMLAEACERYEKATCPIIAEQEPSNTRKGE